MKVTIRKVLDVVSETKDVQDFSAAVLVGFIAEAEAEIVDKIISRYEGFREEDYPINYDENTPTDTELIAPVPYSRIYEYYLKAQIDYARDELELYHNDLAQFEAALSDFRKHYNRTHEHKSCYIKV